MISMLLFMCCIQDDKEYVLNGSGKAKECTDGECSAGMPQDSQGCYADAKTREACLISLARNLSDAKVCENVSVRRDECFFAVGIRDAGACGSITSTADRDICYKEAAFNNKDPGVCGQIDESFLRQWCSAHLNGSVKGAFMCHFPGSLETTKQSYYTTANDQCLIDAVGATGDGMLCLKIKGYEEGYSCQIAYAKAKNDSSVCEGMINVAWKERCRDAFPSETVPQETADAPEAAGAECETDQCWIDAVKATGDGSLCKNVNGYEEGYLCTIAYAKAKNDSSVCDGLFNRGWKERCIEAFANRSDGIQDAGMIGESP